MQLDTFPVPSFGDYQFHLYVVQWRGDSPSPILDLLPSRLLQYYFASYIEGHPPERVATLAPGEFRTPQQSTYDDFRTSLQTVQGWL